MNHMEEVAAMFRKKLGVEFALRNMQGKFVMLPDGVHEICGGRKTQPMSIVLQKMLTGKVEIAEDEE